MKFKNNQKKKKFSIPLVIGVSVLFAALLIAGRTLLLDQPSLALSTEADFGIWYPNAKNVDYELRKDTVAYDESNRILSFVVESPQNGKLTFSQQAVPEVVSGQPDLFDIQLKSLPEVGKFESLHGTVSITHPTGTSEATAIMRSKGTLLYVHSNKTMTTEKWRKIFNSLEINV